MDATRIQTGAGSRTSRTRGRGVGRGASTRGLALLVGSSLLLALALTFPLALPAEPTTSSGGPVGGTGIPAAAGTGGTWYAYTLGVTGMPDDAHFNCTGGVAVNSSGALYVADSNNHRVQVFGAAGDYLYTIGVTGVAGLDDAHFDNPRGVAVNSSGALYVADT
ncbi:MAG: hypothetical protein ACTSU5_12080, partial [Promethearchaeota archaeon]